MGLVSRGQTAFSRHGAYRLHYKRLLDAIDKRCAENKRSGYARLWMDHFFNFRSPIRYFVYSIIASTRHDQIP